MNNDQKVTITVFTPLYNREKTIYKVYESLCKQSCWDFEWLVINDGSSDGSGVIMENILKDHHCPFHITYLSKENEGLMRTINKAIDLSRGILLFRLDSDDFALPEAIQTVLMNYRLIKEDDSICSITFLSEKYNGKINGFHPFKEVRISNFSAYRDKYKATGDRAEVMKVDVFRKFKFPEIEGEKFCPEGLIWNRIARQYDTVYIPKPIYVKGDCDDSITSNVYQYLKCNSRGTSLYYKEIALNTNFSYRYRVVNAIKYYRYAVFAGESIFGVMRFSVFLVAFPLGMIVFIFDWIKNMRYGDWFSACYCLFNFN